MHLSIPVAPAPLQLHLNFNYDYDNGADSDSKIGPFFDAVEVEDELDFIDDCEWHCLRNNELQPQLQ